MNLDISQLCKDPLFQLNLAIWLTQSQMEHSHIYPLFYTSGLSLYSIGPLLALPPDIILAVSDKLNCKNGARPDLVLEANKKRRFCILECKASSFGPDSSTATQARTLLLMAGPILSEVLALPTGAKSEGILCYFTISNQIEMMKTTLESLEKEIAEKVNSETRNYGCLGIRPSQSAILLEYSERIKNFLSLIKDAPVEILSLEEDTDPRPLYFIPYDPNIRQTKEEQELSRRILFERILSYIISKMGGATIPSSITFTTEELLNSATFGVYEVWEDNEAKKHIRRLVRDFLWNIQNSLDESLRQNINYEPQKGWTFNFKDRETYEGMLKQLIKFKPETSDLSKTIESDLFDE